MIHACFHTICYMFCLHFIAFLCIFGTNILTRCHSASSFFLLFFRFRKVLKEIFSELHGTKSSSLKIPWTTRSPKERIWRAVGWPHHRAARVPCLPRHQVVWGPREPSDAALSPICTPDTTTLRGYVIFDRNTRAAAIADKSLFRHPAGTGKCPRSHLHRLRKTSPSTPPPSSSPLLTPMMRRE